MTPGRILTALLRSLLLSATLAFAAGLALFIVGALLVIALGGTQFALAVFGLGILLTLAGGTVLFL
jgi:hypothetical protein